MHAMLGLGASHLDLYGGNCSSLALSHRVRAIQLLNAELTKPFTSAAEWDARFATMFALAFQANCMPEGMTEFISMTRGCHIIVGTAVPEYSADSIFRTFAAEGYMSTVRKQMGPGPPGNELNEEQEKLLDDFLLSLRGLAPLCRSGFELRFLVGMERIARRAKFWAAKGG